MINRLGTLLLFVMYFLCWPVASAAQTPSQHVYTLASNQHLVEFYWTVGTGYTWTYRDLTVLYPGPTPTANSALFGLREPVDQFNANKYSLLYFVGTNQHVYQLSPTLYTDVTSAAGSMNAAAGTGVTGFFSSLGGTGALLDVYYAASNQHVYELKQFANGTWIRTDVTAAAGGTLANVGAGLTGFASSNGEHIYYIGTNQHLNELYWNSGTQHWSNGDLTANHGNVLVSTSSPITSFSDSTGQSVFYVSTTQHVYQMYWNTSNGWSNGDLTANHGNVSVASGSKLTSFSNSTGQHVYYFSTNQHVNELYWNSTNGWSNGDLTTATGAPAGSAGAALTAYALGGDAHVLYSGSDQHVHELFWSSGHPWMTNDITLITSAPNYVTGSALNGISCNDLNGYPNCF